MMRFGAAPVIFLVNNRGYAIEILIHDGPYNRIQNWDYTGEYGRPGDADASHQMHHMNSTRRGTSTANGKLLGEWLQQ
jgi:TPP-dependent 2-oxoacid decarboxylase